MTAPLRILADQNIPREVTEWLRSAGIDAATVADRGLEDADDAAILHEAVLDARIVLTHDGDFGRLAIAAASQAVGVIHLRPGHIGPAFSIDSLRAFLQAGLDLSGPFIAVVVRGDDGVTIRLRKL